MDEPHATLWFNGALIFHGGDDAADRRWHVIKEVLTALGCVDVMISERERSEGSVLRCTECLYEARRRARLAASTGDAGGVPIPHDDRG